MHPSILLVTIFITLSVGYLGDMIEYHPKGGNKEGACGYYWGADDGDPVVAISVPMMNKTSGVLWAGLLWKCGTAIKIWNGATRKSWNAWVVDTCESCGYMDLAVSPSLFKNVAPYAKGRTQNIAWGGDAVGG